MYYDNADSTRGGGSGTERTGHSAGQRMAVGGSKVWVGGLGGWGLEEQTAESRRVQGRVGKSTAQRMQTSKPLSLSVPTGDTFLVSVGRHVLRLDNP